MTGRCSRLQEQWKCTPGEATLQVTPQLLDMYPRTEEISIQRDCLSFPHTAAHPPAPPAFPQTPAESFVGFHAPHWGPPQEASWGGAGKTRGLGPFGCLLSEKGDLHGGTCEAGIRREARAVPRGEEGGNQAGH